MIRIAVIDDDTMILNQIKELIEKYFYSEHTIDLYSDSVDFYNRNSNWNYDIIFLDIDMPEINGFEIAETIGLLKKDIAIVFVSNLEHLVYDAFKFKAFRFVRKSHLSDDTIAAIEGYISEIKQKSDTFLIKTKEISLPTAISEIVYFESMGHDIFVKTASEIKYKILREHEKNITIKLLTEQFEGKGFIRVHKSYLVNYKYIYVIRSSEIVLKNTEKIIINPHKVNLIRNQFQHFIVAGGNIDALPN